MPWKTKDVEQHNAGLSDEDKAKWVSVANSTLAKLLKEGVDQKEAEAKAVRAANGVFVKDNGLKHNEDQEAPNNMRHLMSKLIRKDFFDGREHLVVPTVMITEGVHNNVLYTAKEMQKFAEAWDGRPVVLWHPELNGKPISASKPAVLEQQMLGTVFNTRYEEWTRNGKIMKGLKAEVWFDKAKLEKNGPDVLKMLDENKPIEVSTGLFTDDVAPELKENESEAKWNDEVYGLLATNYRPDHLAILPGGKGACSWEDGAGLPRVNEDLKLEQQEQQEEQEVTLIHVNDQSLYAKMDDISQQITKALYPPPNKAEVAPPASVGYIRDIFDSYVIISEGGKLFEIPYTMEGDTVKVDVENKKQVKEERVFTPVKENSRTHVAPVGSGSNNQTGKRPEGGNMERKVKVEALIKANVGWTQDDAEFLMEMDEAAFLRVNAAAEKAKGEMEDEEEEDEEEMKKVKDNAAKPKTLQELVAEADPQMREALTHGVELHKVRRAQLIDGIKANKRNKFSDEQLGAKPISELEALYELATEMPVDFSGRSPAPKVNAEEDVPAMPTIDWSK